MNEKQFEFSKKLYDLGGKYSLKSEETTGELSEAYNTFSKELAALEQEIQRLEALNDSDDVESAFIKETVGELKSYTKVVIYYRYSNGKALVEDTSGELHLVEQKNLNINSEIPKLY